MLEEFERAENRVPKAWSEKDAEKFLELAHSILSTYPKEIQDNPDLDILLKRFCLQSQGTFPPVGAAFGGVVAQEVIKAITGKYIPVH